MGEPLDLIIDRFETPLGELAIVADGAGRLRAIEWSEQEDRLQRSLRLHYGKIGFTLNPSTDPGRLSSAIRAYFAGELKAIDELPVATGGTDFQRKVWDALRGIPCGTTTTYGDLARRIGRETAIRAVGHANGDNPISIVVPCHRVIGSNGTLTGYGGGIERKRWLLAHERAGVSG